MSSLTAANSTINLTIGGLFDVAQQLQMFSADDVVDTESVQPAEVVMGVDGILSAGWLPTLKKQSIFLMADSPSNAIFDQWAQQQQVINDLYYAGGRIILTGIGTEFILIKGVLTGYQPVPPVKKIIQSRKYEITWNTIIPAPI